jgi:Tfp pilus assembly protein PilX
MKHLSCQLQQQRGATLVVALIMMTLVTLLVTSSFSMSKVNLSAVNNLQTQEGALAAANLALEGVLESPFTDDPVAAASDINVDLNNDNVADYVVTVAVPQCMRATRSGEAAGSSVTLSLPGATWNTVWLLNASVTDAATGASTSVRSAVRVLLSESQKVTACV